MSPFSAIGSQAAVAELKKRATTDCPFTFWTDIDSKAVFSFTSPATIRSCLGGMDGSLLDTYGGEYEWDGYTTLRVAIPLYFLSLYNGGIDAQNTHFQSNKSLNELHFLKYSSIFSFWAKIKDRQFYNQRSNRSMELKSSFFPSEMILSFFSLYNANDNIIFRRETLSPTEMFNSYQKWFRKICFPQPCHSSSTHFSFIS